MWLKCQYVCTLQITGWFQQALPVTTALARKDSQDWVLDAFQSECDLVSWLYDLVPGLVSGHVTGDMAHGVYVLSSMCCV